MEDVFFFLTKKREIFAQTEFLRIHISNFLPARYHTL